MMLLQRLVVIVKQRKFQIKKPRSNKCSSALTQSEATEFQATKRTEIGLKAVSSVGHYFF